MLELLHRRLSAGFSAQVHIKFHPREDAVKRESVKAVGFEELAFDGPFEVEYLTRRYCNVCSIRSSVMLNLVVLEEAATDRRLWLLRSDRQPFRRLYRPAVAYAFDHAVASCRTMEYLDPYSSS